MKKNHITLALILSFNCTVSTLCSAQKLIPATIITRSRDTLQCLIRKPDPNIKSIDKIVTYSKQGKPLITYTPEEAYCLTVGNNYYVHGGRGDDGMPSFVNAGPPRQQIIKLDTAQLEIYVLQLDWNEPQTIEESELLEKKRRLLEKRPLLTEYDTAKSYVINDNKKVGQFIKGLVGRPCLEMLFCGFDLHIFLVRDNSIIDWLRVNTECNFIAGTEWNYFYESFPIDIIKESTPISFATFRDDPSTNGFYAELKKIDGLISNKEPGGSMTVFSKNTARFNAALRSYINADN